FSPKNWRLVSVSPCSCKTSRAPRASSRMLQTTPELKRVMMSSTTAVHDSRKKKAFYQDLSVQVFAGMALGALIGWLWPQSAEWMRTLGDLFIRLIAMFVGLIIFCAVVHGIATVREAKKVGRIAIKALIYFEVVTTFALVIGLAMVNLLGPGRGMHVD